MLNNSSEQNFVNYFGELGPRWGLPKIVCRIHAYLYLQPSPCNEATIAQELKLDAAQLTEALNFLVDFRMIQATPSNGWRTSADPWDMLGAGLEERRRRELPLALATLRDCYNGAKKSEGINPMVSVQIGKMLALVEDLATLEKPLQGLSPQLLRGFFNVSAKATKFFDRALKITQGDRS